MTEPTSDANSSIVPSQQPSNLSPTQTVFSSPSSPNQQHHFDSSTQPVWTTSVSIQQVLSSSLLNIHPMTTRSKAGIFKPKHQVALAFLDTDSLCICVICHLRSKGFQIGFKTSTMDVHNAR